jgi:hypothetical protein
LKVTWLPTPALPGEANLGPALPPARSAIANASNMSVIDPVRNVSSLQVGNAASDRIRRVYWRSLADCNALEAIVAPAAVPGGDDDAIPDLLWKSSSALCGTTGNTLSQARYVSGFQAGKGQHSIFCSTCAGTTGTYRPFHFLFRALIGSTSVSISPRSACRHTWACGPCHW